MGWFIVAIVVLVRFAWVTHKKLNYFETVKANGGKVKNHFEGVPFWRKPFVFIDVIRGTRE